MSKKDLENKSIDAIWRKLATLEESIQKTATEEQQIASNASRKASEYRNKIEESKVKADNYITEIENIKSKFDENINISNEAINKIKELENTALESSVSIKNELEILETKKNELIVLIDTLNAFFEGNTDIEEKIEQLNDMLSGTSEINSKISSIHKSILARKGEIDEVYYDVNGYDEEDEETGEKTRVEGKKDELERSYTGLIEKMTELKKELMVHQSNSVKAYNGIETSWNTKFTQLENEIRSLLPNALTAGLSSAYSDKKTVEETSIKNLEKQFKNAIYGLIGISSIPVIVSIILLTQDVSFEDVIIKLPRILMSILPLYIPVLWLAYSANKKMNLSKRLIEEYTHKEVISRTFEGLSTQIKNVKNESLSEELRIRLLYNLLSTSAENPGKLISDYNKTDHPIFDAIDKSSKLSDAVDRLEKIPGMKKVAAILEKRAEKIMNKEMDKVEEVLEITDITDQKIK